MNIGRNQLRNLAAKLDSLGQRVPAGNWQGIKEEDKVKSVAKLNFIRNDGTLSKWQDIDIIDSYLVDLLK